MALSTLAQAVAERFKKRIVGDFPGRILEVRVFGSMARGDATDASDLDLFVLVDAPEGSLDDPIISAACDIYREFDFPFPISPHIMSRGHFEELIRRERLLAHDILHEGISI